MADCPEQGMSSGHPSAGNLTVEARTAHEVLEPRRRRLDTEDLNSQNALIFRGQRTEISCGTHLRRLPCTAA